MNIDLAKPKSESPPFFCWYLLISENALIEYKKGISPHRRCPLPKGAKYITVVRSRYEP